MGYSSPRSPVLRNVLVLVAAGALAGGWSYLGPKPTVHAQDAKTATPVLVELFTSEGCSDCPPADDLLAKLDTQQFEPGVHAIVLSEHVTYWNHQGWDDPFALMQVDARQDEYRDRFNLKSAYTPQMVVDGTEQFVGNSPRALDAAMAKVASAPKQPLEISEAAWDKSGVHFAVRTTANSGEHLFAAVAQDVSRSDVKGGENSGRTLHHVSVMRSMKEIKSNFADGRALSISASGITKGANAGAVRLVVFLADAKSGHVVGASEKPLTMQ